MCLAHNTFFATPEIMNTAGTYATTICTLPLNTASCNTLCFTFAKHNHSSKSMYELRKVTVNMFLANFCKP